MSKVVKSVSFNPANPEEARMIKAIKRRNFSGYVKKLIAADLDAKKTTQATDTEPAPPQSVAEKLSEIKRNGPMLINPQNASGQPQFPYRP